MPFSSSQLYCAKAALAKDRVNKAAMAARLEAACFIGILARKTWVDFAML
jgi:hypothetical protein